MLAFPSNPTGITNNFLSSPLEEDVSRIMTEYSDVLPLLIGTNSA